MAFACRPFLQALQPCIRQRLSVCALKRALCSMQVRASNKRITAAFSGHPAAAELLQVSGWHTQVVDCEKFWMFDAQPGDVAFGCGCIQSVCCFLQYTLGQTLDGLQTAVRTQAAGICCRPASEGPGGAAGQAAGAPRAHCSLPLQQYLLLKNYSALADVTLACLVRVERACRRAATTAT